MCNKVERRIMKISTVANQVPTIPSSDDHRDGSWIATDIYKGEWFFNQTDGRLFTRDTTNGIIEIPIMQPGTKEYLVILSQSGIVAPTVDYEVNKLGATVSYSYDNTGSYFLNCTGMFADPTKVFILPGKGQALNSLVTAYVYDDDNIVIKTGSPSAANGILNTTSFRILIFP